MLKVHFRCLRLAKSERQRLRRRLDPSPHPASALGLAGVGGRRGCRGTYRNLRLNLCESKVDWFREQRRPHPGSDPAPRKSRGSPKERGIPAGGLCWRRPRSQSFQAFAAHRAGKPGICVVGGRGVRVRERRGDLGGASPQRRARQAPADLCPHPHPRAQHTLALALMWQGCSFLIIPAR